MIKLDMTRIQQAESGMPVHGIVRAASVRALPAAGHGHGIACAKRRDVDAAWDTTVLIADAAVLGDAFPGASAWSPPI